MIILMKVLPESILTMSVSGLIREIVRYISEHQGLLFGIVVGFFLLSATGTRKQNRILLILYSAIIVYMTLLNRPTGARRVNFYLFWSYRFFFRDLYVQKQVLNNILLFVPVGTIVSKLKPRWNTVVLTFLFSLAIEILQFLTARGLFELDDLVNNTLGGLIGMLSCLIWEYVFRQECSDEV